MSGIKRLVLDVQKPINLPSVMIGLELSKVKGVEGVDFHIEDVDQKVEAGKITIEGDNISFDEIKAVIDKLGAAVQSVDRITCGKRIVG